MSAQTLIAKTAGTAPNLTWKVFIEPWNTLCNKQGWGDERIAQSLKLCLHKLTKRRAYLFPIKNTERIHRDHDRWSAIIWYLSIMQEGNISIEDLLADDVRQWIGNGRGCLEGMLAYLNDDDTDSHYYILCEILAKPIPTAISTPVFPTLNKKTQGKTVSDKSSVRRQIGVKFHNYLMSSTTKTNLPDWARISRDYIEVDVPQCFQRYAEERGLQWSELQKGVQMLRVHITDPSGKPDIETDRGRVMRFLLEKN